MQLDPHDIVPATPMQINTYSSIMNYLLTLYAPIYLSITCCSTRQRDAKACDTAHIIGTTFRGGSQLQRMACVGTFTTSWDVTDGINSNLGIMHVTVASELPAHAHHEIR